MVLASMNFVVNFWSGQQSSAGLIHSTGGSFTRDDKLVSAVGWGASVPLRLLLHSAATLQGVSRGLLVGFLQS